MLIFSSRLAEYQNNTKEFFLAQDFLPLDLIDFFFSFCCSVLVDSFGEKTSFGEVMMKFVH